MRIRHFLLLIISFLVFSSQAFAQTAYECIDLKAIESLIDQSRKDWDIPGLSIAIVKNDTNIYEKGFGVRDVTRPGKVDENTLFAIASNTKAFTSAALAVLVDEGKLSWDDRVIDHLPYFELYDPYVTQEMRIRDLLCHRCGLETFSGDLLWYGATYSREEVVRRARYLKPAFSFRSGFGYSNIMFIAAGEIVPAVEGVSWDDFLQRNFFDPLGMSRTNTSITKLEGMENVAMPHYVDPITGNTQKIRYVNWDNVAAAGSINSSVHDMAQWIRMQLKMGAWDGEQIISEDQIWEMRSLHTPQKVTRGINSIRQSQHFSGYGLGLSLMDYQGCKIVGHGGGADGMISRVTFVPEENFGFIILTNSNNSLPSALSFDILDEYFQVEKKVNWSHMYLDYYKGHFKNLAKEEEKLQEKRIKDSKPTLEINAYTGTYGGEMYGDAEVVVEDGNLVVCFKPTPIFVGDLTHWHQDIFRIRLRNIPSLPAGTVRFIIDQEGEVEEMKIDIPNPDFYFTELEFRKKD
jgi:CubicO group peptidase (beta-lactamase class C family)